MTMKKIILLYFALIFTVTQIYSQDASPEVFSELDKIYSNLEYNTIAFEDLKSKWFINDPGFIRELFNRFTVKNALRINGMPASKAVLEEKAKAILEGDVVVDLRRRYYDDEFEYFAFVANTEMQNINPTPLFDPVVDGFYLKDIIGIRLYDKLQEQTYFYSSLTKDVFDTKYGYFMDVNIDLLDPHVLVWSTTSGQRNKYLWHLFGKWGHDEIFMPGWYSSDYTLGSSITYYSALTEDPADYTYRIGLGMVTDGGKMFTSGLSKKPVFKSGDAAYFTFSGDFAKYIWDYFDKVYLNIDAMFTYGDYKYKDFGLRRQVEFASIKNYFSFSWVKRKLYNLSDFGDYGIGGGFVTHDKYSFMIDPVAGALVDTKPQSTFDRFQHYLYLESIIENEGGLIQHLIKIIAGYNLVGGYGYYGIDSKVMLSNNLGLHLKVFNGLGVPTSERYRASSYIVFSPVLRINY